MSKNVLLSVVIPIYGVEKYLRQCVDSVLAACDGIQSEVILVDDGGNDGCPAICDDYVRQNVEQNSTTAVRVIHKRNGGYGSAVNAGFDVAQGEWISIVEPDDWVEKGMYRTLLPDVDDGKADIVKAAFQYVLPSGKTILPRLANIQLPVDVIRISDFPEVLYGHPSIWSAIYRRTFLEKNGIRMEEVPGAGWVDNPFFVQTMCRAQGILFKQGIIYNYRSLCDPIKELQGKWEVPYARIKDELAWFDRNEIETNVLGCRYRAYLVYLGLIAQCALEQVTSRHKVIRAMKEIAWKMDWNSIKATTYLGKRDKMMVWMYRHAPQLAVFRLKKRWRSWVVSGLLRIARFFVL